MEDLAARIAQGVALAVNAIIIKFNKDNGRIS